MPDSRTNPTVNIGFRLEERLVGRLQERASAAGQSAHEMARSLVIAALTAAPQEPSPPAAELNQILDSVAALRGDLSVLCEAALVAGRIFSPSEAKRFVAEKLHPLEP